MRRRVVLGFGGVVATAFAAVLAVALSVTAVRWSSTPDIAQCTGAARLDVACQVQHYDRLTRAAGPRAALTELKAARDGDGFVRVACHQLTHVIGRAAGEQRALVDAFADGDVLCSGGYYHGVVESAMARIGAADIVARVAEVCAGLREQQPRAPLHYYCVHGMGHGFMGLYASDVPASLAGCELLEPWETEHCVGGVFMENLTAVNNPQRPSRFVRPDDPLYPCAEVTAQYRAECYDKQTSYAMFIAGDDVAQVFTLCTAVPAADRTACDRGLGGKVAILANKFVTGLPEGATATRAMCLQGPDPAARTDCVIGAATAPIRDYGGTEQVDALCRALAEPGSEDLLGVCETTRRHAVEIWQLPPPSDLPALEHQH